MSEKRERYYRLLFLLCAVYDIVLGILFIFFYELAFSVLGIVDKLPVFGGYISLIGAFLFVIGIAYWLIYRGDFYKNLDLITVGALYKLAYCTVSFFYFSVGDVPHIVFVALFGVIDLIMFVLMMECIFFLKRSSELQ